MSASHDDDRWSGYLDGELPPDEAAQVARDLALDPEAERLVGELRGIGEELRRLPPLRLESQFAAQVLAAAERELLSDPKPGADALAAATSRSSDRAAGTASPYVVLRTATTTWDWSRVIRPLVWSGAAVAAALTIMAFNPEPKGNRTLAVRPEQAPPTASIGAGDTPVVGSLRAADEDATEAPLDRPMSKGGRGPEAESRLGAEGMVPANAGFPFASRSAPILAPASPAPAASSAAASPETPAEPRPESAAPFLAGDIPADVLVVHCDLTNAAAVAGAFEAVLARQHIPLEPAPAMPVGEAESDVDVRRDMVAEPPDNTASVDSAAAPAQVAADESPAPSDVAEAPAATEGESTLGLRILAEERAATEPASADDAAPVTAARDVAGETPAGEVEVLYVEATPAQLEATLQALNAEPSQFVNVAVMPSPAVPEQQQYTQYNRAGPRQDAEVTPPALVPAAPAEERRRVAETAAPQTAPPAQVPRAQRILRLRGRSAESSAFPPPVSAVRQQNVAGQENLRRALFVLRVLDPPGEASPAREAGAAER